MHRVLILLALGAALAVPALADAQTSGGSKILMFVTDGSRDLELMLTEEVGVMQQMLEDAGFTVDVATVSGERMTAGAAAMQPDLKLTDVDAADYAGFILPCMAPGPGFETPAEITAIIEQAAASGKPIAASRGSVEILASAGALAGKDYAFASAVDVTERPEFGGGAYQGTGVVRDGNVSTAGICPLASRSLNQPDGTQDLTREFIASLTGQD